MACLSVSERKIVPHGIILRADLPAEGRASVGAGHACIAVATSPVGCRIQKRDACRWPTEMLFFKGPKPGSTDYSGALVRCMSRRISHPRKMMHPISTVRALPSMVRTLFSQWVKSFGLSALVVIPALPVLPASSPPICSLSSRR